MKIKNVSCEKYMLCVVILMSLVYVCDFSRLKVIITLGFCYMLTFHFLHIDLSFK
jgi:hypothetical protein